MMPGMEDRVRTIARTPLPGDPTDTWDPLQKRVVSYLDTRSLRERTLEAENRQKAALMETLEHGGREEGEGHRVLDLDQPWPLHANGKDKMIKGVMRQRKVSQVFDGEAALALVKAKGVEADCVTTVSYTEIDEDKVLAQNYAGVISDDEMAALYTNDEKFAFIPVEA